MVFCTRCGRRNDGGNYCMYCGAKLRDRVVTYENSGFLLRSNVVLDNVRPARPEYNSLFVQEESKKKYTPRHRERTRYFKRRHSSPGRKVVVRRASDGREFSITLRKRT